MKIILFLKINICRKNYSIKGINFFPHSGIFRAHVPHKEQDYTKDLIGSRMSCLTNEKTCCVRNKRISLQICIYLFQHSAISHITIRTKVLSKKPCGGILCTVYTGRSFGKPLCLLIGGTGVACVIIINDIKKQNLNKKGCCCINY